MWYFDRDFWKMTGGFLLIIFCGIVALYFIDTQSMAPVRDDIEPFVEPPRDEIRVVDSSTDSVTWKEYTSADLGVQFTFASAHNGRVTAYAKREKNTIFFCPVGDFCERGGQSVEVFATIAATPEVAILDALVPASARTTCGLEELPVGDKYPSSYRMFRLVELAPPPTESPWWGGEETGCPDDYVAQGTANYFLADAERPDRFAFFVVGSSADADSSVESWPLTFRFIQ